MVEQESDSIIVESSVKLWILYTKLAYYRSYYFY